MSHTDPEILALRALGETAGTAADAEHAASCAHCRTELARLTAVVRLVRDAEPVNGNPKVRVPLLKLSLAHATIRKGWHYIKISGIVLTLTSTAASALDATFGTTLFKPGLELGTASTVLRF